MFRVINGIMAAMFLVAAVLQYNDPDPLRWVAIYGLSCALSIVAAIKSRAPRIISGCVAVVALAWGIGSAIGIPDVATYGHMFDAWEMRSQPIEEAREAVGLFIVVAWMATLTIIPSRR